MARTASVHLPLTGLCGVARTLSSGPNHFFAFHLPITSRKEQISDKQGGASAWTRQDTSLLRSIPYTPKHSLSSVRAMSSWAVSGVAEAAPVILHFTPQHALMGGALIGIATVGKLLLTGRVLGVSGAMKGIVNGEAGAWRPTFLTGMLVGGVLLSIMLPTAFETLPATFSVGRAALGGLLVGLGSAFGNGCTSGHGICGNARLSIRSLVYTLTFMAAGVAAATLTGSAEAAGIATSVSAAYQGATSAEVQTAALAAAGSMAGLATLAAFAKGSKSPSSFELPAELLCGLTFALGLGISGMTLPTKVIGFLSALSPSWDLSLMFVMASAVGLGLVGYQGVQRFNLLSKPLTCDKFSIPSSKVIDSRLLMGGLMFGAGWGVSGICPGPGLVNLAAMTPQIAAYVVAMLAGLKLEGVISNAMSPKDKKQ